MKKNWIAGVIALLVVAYPASAWLIGKNVQSSLTGYTDKLQTDAPYFKVAKRSYQGGVFSSTDETTIEIAGDLIRNMTAGQETATEEEDEPNTATEDEDEPKTAAPVEPAKPITLTFRNHIKHGPFAGGALALAKIETELVFDEKIQQEINKAFGGKRPLELITTMGWGGGGTGTMTSPAATIQIQQGTATLTWQGLQGKIDFTKNMSSYRSDISSPGFMFTGGPKKETVKISGMQVLSDKKRLNDASIFYFGKDNGTIKEMSISSETDPGKAVTLKDFTYLSELADVGGFSNMMAKMGADTVMVGADGYGPAHYDFSIKHLHTATLEKLIKSFGEIYSGKHKTPEEITNASLAPWKQFGPDLLKHNPELTIDRISFTMLGGEAILKGNIKIPGVTAEDLANPMSLVPKIDASANIVVPEAMVVELVAARKETEEEKAEATEMMQQQLQGVEQQGYIIRADKMIKSNFEWKGGKGMINGKPFQMPGAPPQE